MLVYLTNSGHRYLSVLLKTKTRLQILQDKETKFLLSVFEKIYLPVKDSLLVNKLYNEGLINQKKEKETEQDIRLLYKRNPLEHINSVVFEYTTACNFNCMHCRIIKTRPVTEKNINRLKQSADFFIKLGIRKFVFIGGEVTKYGNNWLQLSKYINPGEGFKVGVLTNGWWLNKINFSAADKTYNNDLDYLADLKTNGVTHVLFSLDGEEQVHNTWRKHSGLFSEIINGLDKVIKVGLKPRISVVVKDNITQNFLESLTLIAEKIYSLPKNVPQRSKLALLSMDSANIFSNFIDIGNGVQLGNKDNHISTLRFTDIRCKAFYRPSPNIRINANGEVSVCPLLTAGEGYGNIHERELSDILNNMQSTFIYKLHLERTINKYLKYWDTNKFGDKFEHLCSVRTVLSILAKKMHVRNLDLKAGIADIKDLIDETRDECGFGFE